MIPVVVGLFTRRRTIWWVSAGLSVGLIAMISASHLYLGVHWASDVVGALLLGAMFILVVEWVMGRAHGIGGYTLARRRDTDARQTTPIH